MSACPSLCSSLPIPGYLASCDFNNNSWPFCGWTQTCGTNQGTWIRTKHDTPTPGTGPSGDYPDGKPTESDRKIRGQERKEIVLQTLHHLPLPLARQVALGARCPSQRPSLPCSLHCAQLLNRGYFIYQEASNLIPYDLNRLESPRLLGSGEICIDFRYHMFGSEDFNELNVTLLGDQGETGLWSRRGSQSPEWQHGLTSVYFEKETRFQVAFDAIRGLTEFGDTAVDNVVVRRGPCDKPGQFHGADQRKGLPSLSSQQVPHHFLLLHRQYSAFSRSSTEPTPTPMEPSTPEPTPTPVETTVSESCLVSGDPHYYTFDKQTHHFMGNCTYTLSQLCDRNNSLLPYFNVEASNEHRGGYTHVSYVESVHVDVFGIRVTLGKGGRVTVRGAVAAAAAAAEGHLCFDAGVRRSTVVPQSPTVDGEPVIVPSTPIQGVEILPSGFYTVVSTDFGLSVKFDGDHQVEVSLLSTYKGEVCGMCGNYNGDPSDDFLNPDGEPEPDSTSLGNSWQVANLTSCSSGHAPVCTEDEKDTAKSSDFCGRLTDINGPFRRCHNVLDPAGHFESCLYDQCALHLDPGSLCRSLQSYADACQSLGVAIEPWRNATFCRKFCGSNACGRDGV
ncbi:IgGFc-binding protein, partial [Ophiophagus hannah]